MKKVNVFWFRRDLRLDDNTALNKALSAGLPVLPVFIFDTDILDHLDRQDARVEFIHSRITELDNKLHEYNSGIYCAHDSTTAVFKDLIKSYDINAVYANKDYEPGAKERDRRIEDLLSKQQIIFHLYKDQVIFEESEVVKPDGKPYTVYTPYMKKWREKLNSEDWRPTNALLHENFLTFKGQILSLKELGFNAAELSVKPFNLNDVENYANTRDIPAIGNTSFLGPHLRFGTVSIRNILSEVWQRSETFVNELVWREFFMQILYHFPHVVEGNFRSKYNSLVWLNDEAHFAKWCAGLTGYPIVDAGMRELNQTGYMHNRVRMITASFLVKHLLIDWRWGEAYFAEKLLDYELASNNGNWQWVAGTGCDAAPYFRVFNPTAQQKKFDPQLDYIRKWLPEYGSKSYPEPIVDHKEARARALAAYQVII